MNQLEHLRALMTLAKPLPWDVVENSENGKAEAWGYWHAVGPLSLGGETLDCDTRLVHAAINALPQLLAVVEAADKILDHSNVCAHNSDRRCDCGAQELWSSIAALVEWEGEGAGACLIRCRASGFAGGPMKRPFRRRCTDFVLQHFPHVIGATGISLMVYGIAHLILMSCEKAP